MKQYETGIINGHPWVKAPYNDVYKQEDPHRENDYVIILSGPGKEPARAKDIDARKKMGHGYERSPLYTPYRQHEIEAIAGHDNPIVLSYDMPRYYSDLKELDNLYPMPDDLKGSFDTHAQNKKLRVNFRTTNRAGVEVSKAFMLDPKKFIEDELEKAYEWARKNAPKPVDQKTMASTFTNGILRLADSDAIETFRSAKFDEAAENEIELPGAHFNSPVIDAVVFTKNKSANRVMTKVEIGLNTIIEDASGVTVTWEMSISDAVTEGLAGHDLGEIIDADWAKGMKIRKAEPAEIINPADKYNSGATPRKGIKIRAAILYEELETPGEGQEIDYLEELKRHVQNFAAQGNKMCTALTWLLDTMNIKQKAVVFSQMINSENVYIRLDDIGLPGWIIQREYGARYHITQSPGLTGDDLNKYLEKIAA